MGQKKPFNLQHPTTQNKTQAILRTNKTPILLIFAIIYGLIFLNYIDVITPGGSIEGYHTWLVIMYFFPFAALAIIDIKNLKLAAGLGLTASLMNDVFYGLIRNLMGQPYDLAKYYNLWLIPQTTKLFTLNLGFTTIEVQSWMMAASIYLRIAVVALLIYNWKPFLAKMPLPKAINMPKLKSIQSVKVKDPITEIYVVPPGYQEEEQEIYVS